MSNPFLPALSLPGRGTILVNSVSTESPILSYQYPLKLIAPSTTFVAANPDDPVHTVFLLTYGGGIVAGDSISLDITLAPSSRLALLTQGSTKIFKTPSSDLVSRQWIAVRINPGAALCYLPDPVQPFAESAYEQVQVFNLVKADASDGQSEPSLCLCDWVSEGRRARGEKWDFWRYGSKTEVWAGETGAERRRLLLRDNILLCKSPDQKVTALLGGRMDELGAFGTLFLRGPLFQQLAQFFMTEFKGMPRIGARDWDGSAGKHLMNPDEAWRTSRQTQEVRDGILWTASAVRGFVVVKFAAKQVEGVRIWLREMLTREGSIEREFGEKALLCLK